jgi:hypothetical protein
MPRHLRVVPNAPVPGRMRSPTHGTFRTGALLSRVIRTRSALGAAAHRPATHAARPAVRAWTGDPRPKRAHPRPKSSSKTGPPSATSCKLVHLRIRSVGNPATGGGGWSRWTSTRASDNDFAGPRPHRGVRLAILLLHVRQGIALYTPRLSLHSGEGAMHLCRLLAGASTNCRVRQSELPQLCQTPRGP